MNGVVVAAGVIAAAVSLILGVAGSVFTVNYSRASAATILRESAEQAAGEVGRMNDSLTEARRLIVLLLSAIDQAIPMLSGETRWYLMTVADEARVKLKL
jgi:hypothetical protein